MHPETRAGTGFSPRCCTLLDAGFAASTPHASFLNSATPTLIQGRAHHRYSRLAQSTSRSGVAPSISLALYADCHARVGACLSARCRATTAGLLRGESATAPQTPHPPTGKVEKKPESLLHFTAHTAQVAAKIVRLPIFPFRCCRRNTRLFFRMAMRGKRSIW